MKWLWRLYSRRIVNVNVNIIVAGALSMLLTLIPVRLSRHVTDNPVAIFVITIVADLIFDVAIYYVLHWIANHWPHRKLAASRGEEAPGFLKDATLVQFQRAVLSPVLYTVVFGLQFYLLREGVARELASIAGLSAGILSTRALHTFWMLRSEQRTNAARASSPARGGSGTSTPAADMTRAGTRATL